MSNLPPLTKRHRGGQPGNLNALKHGFYTRRFNPTDLAGVESTDYNGLLEEIAIIRLYARRLIELDDQSTNITQVANTLRILCLASLTITRLVKTSQFLQVNNNSNATGLHKALEHLTDLLKLDQVNPPPDDILQSLKLPVR
jgi:hypothetical protein